MSEHIHTLDRMLQRANLDGSGDATEETSLDAPLIVLSLATDPDSVTVVPRPPSKVAAKHIATEIFDLRSSAPLIFKRRMVTSDGRTVWASIPEDYWKAVLRDGDEVRLFRNTSEIKPQWDRVAATIIYGSWQRVMLLSDTYKATKEDIFRKINLVYPKSITTSSDIRFRLIIGELDSDGEYDTALLHQKGDTDDEWRDLIRQMKKEQKHLRLEVTKKQRTRG